MRTIVVFRKFNGGGEIIALFPYEVNYPGGHCESYMHVGQHSSADYGCVVGMSKPATPKEYKALKEELERIGYELNIKKKRSFR